MPFIQCDIEQGLSEGQKTEIITRMIDVTNKAIGSSCEHINVVLREHPKANLGETGKAGLGLISQRQSA